MKPSPAAILMPAPEARRLQTASYGANPPRLVGANSEDAKMRLFVITGKLPVRPRAIQTRRQGSKRRSRNGQPPSPAPAPAGRVPPSRRLPKCTRSSRRAANSTAAASRHEHQSALQTSALRSGRTSAPCTVGVDPRSADRCAAERSLRSTKPGSRYEFCDAGVSRRLARRRLAHRRPGWRRTRPGRCRFRCWHCRLRPLERHPVCIAFAPGHNC